MMKTDRGIIFLFFFFLCIVPLCASSQGRGDELALTVPVIHSHYNPTNWGAGSSWSKGVGVACKHYMFGSRQHFFVTGSVGYYRQNFDVLRELYPTGDPYNDVLYLTPRYHYDNIQWTAGVGYRRSLAPHYFVSCALSFTDLETFHQYYFSYPFTGSEKRHFGSWGTASFGISRTLGRHWKAGVDALMPFLVRWKRDPILDRRGGYDKGSTMGVSVSVGYRIMGAK